MPADSIGAGTRWPGLTPQRFTHDPHVRWRDGKPWCRKHGRVIVTAASLGIDATGTHVCPTCMRAHAEAQGWVAS